MAGIALGYPQDQAAVNTFQRHRADLETFVTWVE